MYSTCFLEKAISNKIIEENNTEENNLEWRIIHTRVPGVVMNKVKGGESDNDVQLFCVRRSTFFYLNNKKINLIKKNDTDIVKEKKNLFDNLFNNIIIFSSSLSSKIKEI